MSATPLLSADPDRPSSSLGPRIRNLGPKTFQARLTVALVLLIAVTLTLVSLLVVNRLDDYFTQQQRAGDVAPGLGSRLSYRCASARYER